MILKTKVQKERDEMHEKVRKLYRELSAEPRNAKTAIEQKIMKKFGFTARSTVWSICNGYTDNNEAVGSGVNPRI